MRVYTGLDPSLRHAHTQSRFLNSRFAGEIEFARPVGRQNSVLPAVGYPPDAPER
jgi:hypothetical protein